MLFLIGPLTQHVRRLVVLVQRLKRGQSLHMLMIVLTYHIRMYVIHLCVLLIVMYPGGLVIRVVVRVVEVVVRLKSSLLLHRPVVGVFLVER